MDIPYNIFVLYIVMSMTIGILGIFLGLRKIAGSPFITIFSAIMIWGAIAIIDNVAVDYAESIDYTLIYPMNVTTGSASTTYGTTVTGAGERPANTDSLLYNKPISCISVDLSRTGSAIGTATIGILDDDNMVVKSFGTIDSSTVSTSRHTYKFCLSNHDYYTIGLYDRIGMKYTTGIASNTLNIFSDATNVFDSTNSVRTTFTSGVWSDATASDMRIVLIFDDANISGEPINYDLNDNDIWVFLITLGGFFMWMGVMLQIKDWKLK